MCLHVGAGVFSILFSHSTHVCFWWCQAKWARTLHWLWSQLVRQLLDTLRDTISTESPSAEYVLLSWSDGMTWGMCSSITFPFVALKYLTSVFLCVADLATGATVATAPFGAVATTVAPAHATRAPAHWVTPAGRRSRCGTRTVVSRSCRRFNGWFP